MPQLDGKQIKDTSILDAALANVGEWLKRGVAVAWTVAQNAGGQRLTNLGAPNAPGDAARLQDVYNRPPKEACRAATTVNITLSGSQTVDGVTLSANERVLVKDQTVQSENGVYLYNSGGAWSRAADFDDTVEVQGGEVNVLEGTVNADTKWLQTGDDVVVDTDNIAFVKIGPASGSAAYPSSSNKSMTASVTSSDGDAACATTIAATPAGDGYVSVMINGVLAELKGDKTGDCYFSSDGGTTARAIADITSGDTAYWNGTVAGYELAATDVVDFLYTV